MAWQTKDAGAPAPTACNLTPSWLLDCTLFSWGGFNVALPRAIAAPGLAPPLHPPDSFPWPITAALHLNREMYVRIGSIPAAALTGLPIQEQPMAVIQTIMQKRGLDKVSVAQGDHNVPSWGAHAAKRAAFILTGTDGTAWLEDFLVVARTDAGAIMLATLVPETDIPKLAYFQYLIKRTLHWDPQGFSRPTPMQIAPSIYFEQTSVPILSQAAVQQKGARIAAMAHEPPQVAATIAQVFKDLTNRPIVEWDAPVPPEWWQKLQSIGQMFQTPNARGLYENHVQYVRNGRDLQGLAMVWATA